MNNKLIVLLLVALATSCTDNYKYADPFIGTDYTGHTFPAASCPLGMVQPGPQTGNYLWKYCSGYNYSDSLILGFAQNRLNGTGVPSLCNILMMPFSDTHGEGYSSVKKDESAAPGFYGVSLPDNGTRVGITCSPRVACYDFDFGGSTRNLFINFQNIQMRDRTSTPSMKGAIRSWEGCSADANTLRGHIAASSWVDYDLWYEIVFDQPVKQVDTVCIDPTYVGPAVVLDFGAGKERLKAKVSISYTSSEGAHTNLAEVRGWNFNKVRKSAEKGWRKVFGLIDIDASDSIKTAFYTSLYHLYLQPNIISDLGAPVRYSSFWQCDAFRAAGRLRTLLTLVLVADV